MHPHSCVDLERDAIITIHDFVIYIHDVIISIHCPTIDGDNRGIACAASDVKNEYIVCLVPCPVPFNYLVVSVSDSSSSGLIYDTKDIESGNCCRI